MAGNLAAFLLDDRESVIDQVLVVCFEAPRSYTGEDVVEIHTHGGTLVAQLCLEALLRRGARLAEPGEFTRRGTVAPDATGSAPSPQARMMTTSRIPRNRTSTIAALFARIIVKLTSVEIGRAHV